MALPFALVLALALGAERPTLQGVVEGRDGAPLSGAKVMIYTARPRQGGSGYSASCTDCGRSAMTSADGRFTIPDLDPGLVFRIVGVAQGHEAVLEPQVDPKAGPLKLTLAPKEALPADPKRVFKARVVGPRGPVPDVVVEVLGYTRGQSTTMSPISGPAITDAQGALQMSLPEEADSLFLAVSPQWLARRTFSAVPTGVKPNTLSLTTGVSVRGRVVKADKPLADVAVNLETKEQAASGSSLGAFSATTNDAGEFLISNVPPNEAMVVVGSSESLGALGYVPSRDLMTGPDGTMADVGDLEVRPGRRVAGRVVLADRAPLPQHTRLTLAREDVTDPRVVDVRSDGAFEIVHVAEGVLDLAVDAPGYQLSSKNQSLVPSSRSSLRGRVDRDLNLILLLEKAEEVPTAAKDLPPPSATSAELLRKKPLAGVDQKSLEQDRGSEP